MGNDLPRSPVIAQTNFAEGTSAEEFFPKLSYGQNDTPETLANAVALLGTASQDLIFTKLLEDFEVLERGAQGSSKYHAEYQDELLISCLAMLQTPSRFASFIFIDIGQAM